MKTGDQVLVQGNVAGIIGDKVIVKNERSCFVVSKEDIAFDFSITETVYPTEKYMAVMDGELIRIIKKDDPCCKVIIDRSPYHNEW